MLETIMHICPLRYNMKPGASPHEIQWEGGNGTGSHKGESPNTIKIYYEIYKNSMKMSKKERRKAGRKIIWEEEEKCKVSRDNKTKKKI